MLFFPNLYGEKNVTYNIHNLLHIGQSAREIGYINDIAAYKFENFLQTIKLK